MHKILQQKNLENYEKAPLYLQVLQSYVNFQKPTPKPEMEHAGKVPKQDRPHIENADKSNKEYNDSIKLEEEIKNQLINKVPVRCKDTAEEILSFLKRENTVLSWTPQVFNDIDNMPDVEGTNDIDHLYSNMALFYLKLHAKHLVPNTVIQDINEQFSEVNKELSSISSNILMESLKSASIDDKIIEEVLNKFNNSSIEQLSFDNISAASNVSHEVAEQSMNAVSERKTTAKNLEWAHEFAIPWENLDHELIKSLEEGNRPSPSLRRKMIRTVADAIQKITEKPGKMALGIIARKMVNKYPSSLADSLCGEIVGEGYSSIHKQMEVRFDNLNRTSPFNLMRRKVKHQEESPSVNKRKLGVSDCYGTVNWQPPSLPIHETEETQNMKKITMQEMALTNPKNLDRAAVKKLLQETYYTVRIQINNGNSIASLKEEWPLLFSQEGIYDHFESLVGFDILEKFSDSVASKGFRLMSYLKSVSKVQKYKEKFQQWIGILELESCSENPNLCPLICLLMVYFKENIEDLFIAVDNHLKAHPNVDTIHGMSDSPSNQYRNKTMFYIISTVLKEDFPCIKKVTWNYTEAGHGKGAPDGIGGVLKRTADRIVAQGADLANYHTLFEALQKEVVGVKLTAVTKNEIIKCDNLLAGKPIYPFKGTAKVHQVTWSEAALKTSYRKLSCFDCSPGKCCKHYEIKPATKRSRCQGASKKSNPPQTSDHYTNITNTGNLENLQIGDWVVVIYDSNLYPGEITNIVGSEYEINAMEHTGKGVFKWPIKSDVCMYHQDDIKSKISAPLPCKKQSGSRTTKFYFQDYP
ncbi:hypothetical protein JTE90_003448 [Oedothorax gibbosus]|uniref:Uncharacterized protein n=1 Tax=Oedothorax gibbosus TaxID=931172 RepID=A0AAV6TXP5_9ARAC|nr:hypothetical protein JTE90_003448 [Oedothorax gibbosus]